jgi:hypothetical protein
MLLLSLALKLGFHICTKAVLVAISAIPRNKPPLGQYQLKIAITYLLDYALYIGDSLNCFCLVLL